MGRRKQISSGRFPPRDSVAKGLIIPPPASIANRKNDLRPSAIGLKLFAALEREGIRYCHWKSNVRLDQTLAGLQDIDLLVDPEDAHAFQCLINECGFKLTVSRKGVGHAGVFHALAWDPDSGRLLDLHAYHQLISGDSLVKSYRFAVEKELLQRTSSLMSVRIPDPAAELVLFLLRILLKHTSLIEIRKVNSRYGHCRDELSWLVQRSDLSVAAALYDGWFPSIRIPFHQMIECVAKGSVASRLVMGMRVAWALRHQRRIGHIAAGISRLIRFGGKYAARIRKRRNLSLLAGGAWIALAGPEESGTSTLTKLLVKRLGTKLDVKRFHFGKPPKSWLSFVPRTLGAAARKSLPIKRFGDQRETKPANERHYSTWSIISKLLIALDRQRILSGSMRAMSSGTILISDHCHLTNAMGLDGSAFNDLAFTRARSPLQRWLIERERAVYRSLPRPRIILLLSGPKEVAPGRDGPSAIQRRSSRDDGPESAMSTVCPINTDGDIDDILRRILVRVWQSL